MKGRDIMIDPQTGDLVVRSARNELELITEGLAIGDVHQQNQAMIITMHPAEEKEFPTLGVGISSMILTEDTLRYKHLIREQLEADGFRVSYLTATLEQGEADIAIKATYN